MNNTKSRLLILFVIAALYITLASLSCGPAGKPVKITTFEIPNPQMYVQTLTELTCVAISETGDKITYKWSCDKGTLSGEGQKVTWTSPNEYGSFHIMVTAQDTKGNSDQAAATIKVIYNPNPFECPSCNK